MVPFQSVVLRQVATESQQRVRRASYADATHVEFVEPASEGRIAVISSRGLAAWEFQELNGIWPYEISTFLEAGARRGTDFLKIASHGGFIDGLSLDHSVSDEESNY